MSPVTSARVAVIQDVQTLCIHYTDYCLPPPNPHPLPSTPPPPPVWMAPQLSQSESQMRRSVRVCLLVGHDLMLLRGGRRSRPREPRSAGGQHSPRARPGRSQAHAERRADTAKRGGGGGNSLSCVRIALSNYILL